jgi:hypothetical protein
MMRTALLASSLLATLGATACQDQVTEPSRSAAAPRPSAQRTAAAAPRLALGAVRSRLRLPALGQIADLPRANLAARAIDPGDYVCVAESPVNLWLIDKFMTSATQEPELFSVALGYAADLIPLYEAVYLQSSATPQYFGQDGAHTKAVVKAERDLKRFWDIPSSDIQVVGMHGSMLVDTARTAATFRFLGFPDDHAAYYALTLRNTMRASRTMAGGNHPYFTFNAVAATTPGGAFPDKIVMGDGILAGYDAVGLGDVAPQAIFAHEFAHHVQFEQPGYRFATSPEEARFLELSADALAAYFLTHKRGATMNRKRVEQFLEVFHQIGDCQFTSDGHHGTPNQRLAAARFGFDLADQAQKQGHILTSKEVLARFLATYPTIIAPDAR